MAFPLSVVLTAWHDLKVAANVPGQRTDTGIPDATNRWTGMREETIMLGAVGRYITKPLLQSEVQTRSQTVRSCVWSVTRKSALTADTEHAGVGTTCLPRFRRYYDQSKSTI